MCVLFIACAGAEAGPSGPLVTGEFLTRWLDSLVITAPDVFITDLGLRVSLTGLRCTHFQLQHLDSSQPAPLSISIRASGIGASCNLGWGYEVVRVPFLRDSGLVAATLGGDSFLSDVLEMVLDDDKSVPLPTALRTGPCEADLQLTTLSFGGHSLLDWILKALESIIRSELTKIVSPLICQKLDEAVSHLNLTNVSSRVRELALAPAKPVDPLPVPGGDDYVFWNRSRVLHAVARTVSQVLSNSSSSGNINVLLARLLNSDGNVTLWNPDKAPRPLVLKVQSLGSCEVKLPSLSLGGLTSFTSVLLEPWALLTGLQLGAALQEFKVSGNASITCTPVPPMTQGPPLTELFSFFLRLRNVSFKVAGELAVHSHLLNDRILAEPEHCLPAALAAARLHNLTVGLLPVEAAIHPQVQEALEHDVDHLIDVGLATLLAALAPSADVLLSGFVGSTGRDALNNKAAGLRPRAACAPGPPADEYTFYSVSKAAGVLAATLALPTIALLLPRRLPCISRRSDHARQLLLLASPSGSGTQVGACPNSASRSDGSGQNQLENLLGDCLAAHPNTGLRAALGIPLLLLLTASLFLASNMGVGAEVWANLHLSGDSFSIRPVFDFSLLSSIKDMWSAGSYFLAVLIGFFSGVWPYLKLLCLLVCWLLPTKRLSVAKRQGLLQFVDAYGKFSLIDTYVLVLFMVSFHIVISSTDPTIEALLGDVGPVFDFRVQVTPPLCFFLFVAATILSLLAGHLAVAFHRFSLVKSLQDMQRDSPATPMYAVARASRLTSGCVVVALLLSLVFVLAGASVDSFRFDFGGLAGVVLGKDSSRPYSLISLGTQLPDCAGDLNYFGVLTIQVMYFLFSFVMVVLYHLALLFLWLWPLRRDQQRRALVFVQTLRAWSALDAFVCSIIAAVLEISQLVVFIVGDRCDAIEAFLRNPPPVVAERFPAALKEHPQCVNLTTALLPGCWLLFTSAVVSTIVGQAVQSRITRALGCDVRTRAGSADSGNI